MGRIGRLYTASYTFLLHRFAKELLLLDHKRNESPSEVQEETIQISDDSSMLAQSVDDFVADDEGFAELDTSKVLKLCLENSAGF